MSRDENRYARESVWLWSDDDCGKQVRINEMYDFIPRWRGLFRVCYADIYIVARKYCDTCGESVMNLEKIFFKLQKKLYNENLCALVVMDYDALQCNLIHFRNERTLEIYRER